MKNALRLASTSFLFLLSFLVSHSAFAIQASPVGFVVHQPDGTAIEMHINGDEHYNWLTNKQGYTVLRDEAGLYRFAQRNATGDLQASKLTVGIDNPTANGIEPGLKPSASVMAQYRSIRGDSHNRAGNPARVPPLGNVTNMVIMIRFSDHQARPLPSNSDIETLFNAVGGDPALAPTGSVRDVYLENSYGQMTLNSTIFGWVDLPQTEAYYANGASGDSTLWQGLRFALDQN